VDDLSGPAQPLSLDTLGVSRSDQLERLNDAGLIAQGRVFLLSLQPVKDQLGTRWANRQELVWETVERALVKRMPAPDVFVRINEIMILAAVASTDSYEGQVMCAEVLRSVLAFFLGRAVESDVGISRVSGIGPNGLIADPVDLTAPAPVARPSQAASPARKATPPDRWKPPLAGRRISGLITTERNGDLSLDIEIVPVWRLDHEIIGAYALRPHLPIRPEFLTDADREAINSQILEALIPILREYQTHGAAFALMLPVAFSVISVRRSRLAMIGQCADVADLMRRVVILEIEGMNAGVPAGLVGETAAMIRPFAKALTVVVQDNAETQTAFREAAFHGLAIDAARGSAKAIETLIRSARRRTPNVMVHDAPDGFTADWLKACGASHVSWAHRHDLPKEAPS